MKHTIVICGYGPAIADAVARRFGAEGHPVALIARNAQRLSDAVASLQADGIRVQSYVADLGDTAAVSRVMEDIRADMGPVGILHWNAFSDIDGDLLSTAPEALSQSLAVRVVGYIAAVQAVQPDLEVTRGAVLATSGVMAFYGSDIDSFAKDFGALAVSVAAQHKATGVLTQTLAQHGIYVGEVVVNGFVKKSAGSVQHETSVDPEDVAEQFWQMNAARTTHSMIFGGKLSFGAAS
ncbi:SDR family NAD(P)-dependent oxidoreductase [Xenorhabdus sp. TH1]|uniref:SDR family NAD(P)-dependent oxidoreductase n=1 Tax=Xenorhabdus sp. TH1 TaxID=3130166 RepID=UPI0030D403D6